MKRRNAIGKAMSKEEYSWRNSFSELIEKKHKEEKSYKVRVTDKKTSNSYVRMATRSKIAELRSNPNISSV